MKKLAVLAAFWALPALGAVQHQREILIEFENLLAIPNLASDAPNIQRNADAIVALFAKRNIAARTLKVAGAPPLVVADLPAPGAKRTIIFYAHYDGQPVDKAKWKNDPWTPVMRDARGNDVDWKNATAIDPEWRLYARSAGDDKAPIIAMLAAIDTLRAQNRKPSVNLRFVFEGEEEAGSPHLAEYLAAYPDLLRPDAWIICDGPVHQSRRMQLFFGVRGVIDLEITLYGPIKGLHDGHYGNWVPNPIVRLASLITSMRDENGRILINGFYDQLRAPNASEREALAKVPRVENDLRREFQIGSAEADLLNDRLMLPALNLRGIEGGRVGELASNSIPTMARASIDFRLVPDLTPESIKPLVERHIAAQGYTIVRETPDAAARIAHPKIVKLEWGSGYPSARTPLDLPLSRKIAATLTAAGHEPVLLPTLGGSVPMYLFQQPAGTPVIGFPIANHDNNQHSHDENLRLQNLWDAVEMFTAVFSDL